MHGNNEPASNREAMLVAKFCAYCMFSTCGSLTHVAPHSWMLTGASVFVPVSRWLAGDLMRLGVPAFNDPKFMTLLNLTVGEPNAHAPLTDIRQARICPLKPFWCHDWHAGVLGATDLSIDAVNKLGASSGSPWLSCYWWHP